MTQKITSRSLLRICNRTEESRIAATPVADGNRVATLIFDYETELALRREDETGIFSIDMIRHVDDLVTSGETFFAHNRTSLFRVVRILANVLHELFDDLLIEPDHILRSLWLVVSCR